ncbi:lanthionine synthetase LanC family protein [Pedobacter sp. NJ-S-72]
MGRGGVSYTLAKASKVLNHDYYLFKAISLMDNCPDTVTKDSNFDLLGGTAGIILSFLHLLSHHDDHKIITKINNLTNILIKNFKFSRNSGISWGRSARSKKIVYVASPMVLQASLGYYMKLLFSFPIRI